jgi:2-keto-4-pentenoate hydratase
MTDPGTGPDALAAEILAARAASGCPMPVPFTSRGLFPLDLAYDAQDRITAARLARGERVVGWKLGYTSPAMREQMGVAFPNFGPLTDAMVLGDGDVLPPGTLHPRVEPEIALVFGETVPPDADTDAVMAACARAVACLEVVDSVWEGYRFRLEDNTADGSSAAFVVLGEDLPTDDLPAVAVDLSVDGALVESGTAAAASGHPAAGVAWLAARLAERGRAVEAGHVVLTGGLTKAPYLLPGGTITARFQAGGTQVEVSCAG